MAFITIPSSIIQVGKAIKKEIFDLLKGNLDDLDSRVSSLEVGATKIDIFKFQFANAASFNTATGVFYYEADQDFTITDVYLRIFEKGTLTGTLEIDIKKSATDLDGPSFSSIFTTLPSIAMASASNYDASINQVFNPSQVNIQKGDFLRVDITSMPLNGVLGKFLLTAYGE